MQSQMIGMQSSLDRILSAVQNSQGAPLAGAPPHMYPPPMEPPRDMAGSSQIRNGFEPGPADRMRVFPPLPGFAPPVCLCDSCVPSSPDQVP